MGVMCVQNSYKGSARFEEKIVEGGLVTRADHGGRGW